MVKPKIEATKYICQTLEKYHLNRLEFVLFYSIDNTKNKRNLHAKSQDFSCQRHLTFNDAELFQNCFDAFHLQILNSWNKKHQ